MLKRYMDPKRIPKNPNWAIVLKTSNWVLEECPENQPLKTEIKRVKDSIEQSIILKKMWHEANMPDSAQHCTDAIVLKRCQRAATR